MFEVSIEGHFSAAHQVFGHEGLTGKIHGHNYRVVVIVAGKDLNRLGFLIEFSAVKSTLAQVISYLDHESLNDLEPFRVSQPTCEMIARYVYHGIMPSMPMLRDNPPAIHLQRVVIYESDAQSATYSE